jgi:LCP family protein required for cell wall assembly
VSAAGMAEEPGRRAHRTWPERLAIFTSFLSATLCFIVAAALVIGYLVVRQRNIVEFDNPADAAAEAAAAAAQDGNPAVTIRATTTAATSTAVATEPALATDATTTVAAAAASTDGAESTAATTEATAVETEPTTTLAPTTTTLAPDATFPVADPEARNFLITGADNSACVDPDSPYYATFGDREGMGERSDTVMVLRVDPDADRVAVLSFPRDLYVEIAGTGGMSRINSAYERDNPQNLIDTIYNNFGIGIDHYIQVDFCAFKELVDAVGGVTVPFQYAARDDNTGLNVPAPGCFTFDGEHALAYVRSRHYQYEEVPGSGEYTEDPSSDLGRISRQQDFIRRTLSSILDEGPLNPRVARGLIRAATRYIVTDRDLTPAKMMEFAGVMNDVDPASILTYQIEASGRNINGNSVLIPNVEGENMQAVLALFRGETSLADAPEQVFEQTTTAAPRQSTTTSAAVTGTEPAGTVTEVETTLPAESTAVVSVPTDGPQENQIGIFPPRDVTC